MVNHACCSMHTDAHTESHFAGRKQIADASPESEQTLPQSSTSSTIGSVRQDTELDSVATLNECTTISPASEETATESIRKPEPIRSRPCLQHNAHSGTVPVQKGKEKTWYTHSQKGYRTTVKYFYEEIDSSWTAISLIACFFVAGLVDSVAFSLWSVFVAMQTGNTIFLALRITGQPVAHHPLNFVKSLTSLICYCLGALAFNCLHRAPIGLSEPRVPLHRWTLITSFVIQTGLLLVAAILAQASILSAKPYRGGTFSSGSNDDPGDNYFDLIGIGLLACEAAGQVCLSRVLLVNELPTIVLSTLYHDLIGEALGMRRSWRESKTTWDFFVAQKKQIRRLACIISLFGGAVAGGLLFRSRVRLAAALWLAAGVKMTICIAWCLWKKKVVTQTTTSQEQSLSRPA